MQDTATLLSASLHEIPKAWSNQQGWEHSQTAEDSSETIRGKETFKSHMCVQREENQEHQSSKTYHQLQGQL